MDDRELVTLVRAGDFDATSVLLSRYQDVAFTVTLRILGNPADAEDVTQEALMRSYLRLAELEEGASFGAWIRRIAVNLSLNVLRRRGQLRFESLESDIDAEVASPMNIMDVREPTPEDAFVNSALKSQIESFLALLPAEQRVAVVLRDMYDYDVAEVAELQQCGLSAAKMRITRGRAALRRLLEEERRHSEGKG